MYYGIQKSNLPINCKIDPSESTLNSYSYHYKWIPNFNMIRPVKEDLDKKIELLSTLEMYQSKVDYIATNILKFKCRINKETGKLESSENIFDHKIKKFCPNLFPYNISEGYHYVMWYTYNDLSNNEISQDIYNSIKELTKENFNFVWYINPKMTFPEIFHVQVFWNFKK